MWIRGSRFPQLDSTPSGAGRPFLLTVVFVHDFSRFKRVPRVPTWWNCSKSATENSVNSRGTECLGSYAMLCFLFLEQYERRLFECSVRVGTDALGPIPGG
ncbi:hypothetical protein BJX64DRAFT_260082 [Aspergillus heterothallicus]